MLAGATSIVDGSLLNQIIDLELSMGSRIPCRVSHSEARVLNMQRHGRSFSVDWAGRGVAWGLGDGMGKLWN